MIQMEVFKEPSLYGVYIMEFEDSYKVGISSQVETRTKALRGRLLDFTEVGDCSEAFVVEHRIHKRLSQYRTKGEYFNCDYQTIVEVYNECLSYDTTTCIPYNHTNYVGLLTKVTIPELDGSLESIIRRGKYLATM